MREGTILNLQLKGMMEAYDMANLFLVAGYTSLAKIHYKRFHYLMSLHEKYVRDLIIRDNEIPNSGKVGSMYSTPLSKENAIALIPTAIKAWIDWGESMLAELDKGTLYLVVAKDLKLAKKWAGEFPSVDESVPPMRQLMRTKLMEANKNNAN